jgi:hypothetical protein
MPATMKRDVHSGDELVTGITLEHVPRVPFGVLFTALSLKAHGGYETLAISSGCDA